LVFLRMLLGNIGVVVLPDQQAIPHADQAFNGDCGLVDNAKHNAVVGLGVTLAQYLKAIT
jgi:chromate reductase, NAD(P)H dehydrogenase (quinone)